MDTLYKVITSLTQKEPPIKLQSFSFIGFGMVLFRNWFLTIKGLIGRLTNAIFPRSWKLMMKSFCVEVFHIYLLD